MLDERLGRILILACDRTSRYGPSDVLPYRGKGAKEASDNPRLKIPSGCWSSVMTSWIVGCPLVEKHCASSVPELEATERKNVHENPYSLNALPPPDIHLFSSSLSFSSPPSACSFFSPFFTSTYGVSKRI